MFTGIVEGLGRVTAIDVRHDKGRLQLDLESLADGVAVGDSVAVDGVCLTAAVLAAPRVAFDVSGETLSRTTLGGCRVGDSVNVERALRVGDRMGGHFVQGHVDGVGVLSRKDVLPGQWTVEFIVPADLAAAMILKGSVAVDGISLTICDLSADRFSVALIPHTLLATTLRDKTIGGRVNIETDLIGKYVARLLGQSGDSHITPEFLARHGFAT